MIFPSRGSVSSLKKSELLGKKFNEFYGNDIKKLEQWFSTFFELAVHSFGWKQTKKMKKVLLLFLDYF